ncbi:MAG: PEGA domain-containing protein [Candidatus Sulfotelmatobacter sp.]
MSTKIGHFEILSELSKSATGTVYKANDPQTSQTVALKAIELSAFGERAGELEKCLLAEAETTKALSHSNLTPVYGAGEIDGQFCAAMEYIQGNSIATMLARKEGFSIWDLLDIGRQVCSGLDHAQSHNVFHYSLEPSKIMCGWDSTVRILGYGVSSVGRFTDQMPAVPSILHYMSPEQVRGENIDLRSNLFSLGAIFYEMVTDQLAFEGEDPESVCRAIIEGTPAAPNVVNPKIHPVLSDLIMKAISKDPGERYQSARELLDDLEKCKESKAPAAKQQAAPTTSVVVPDAVKAATQAKFIASAAPSAAPKPAAAAPKPATVVPPAQGRPAAPSKAVAASAGGAASSTQNPQKARPTAPSMSVGRKPNLGAPSASMSAAGLEEPAVNPPQVEAPKINVDPMMAEDGPSRAGALSFSEMTELPPLKESYTEPTPPPPVFEAQAPHSTGATMYDGVQEKPKIQPREVAEKAMKEIKNVPPRLMVYSVAGAAVLILVIAIALVMHVNSLNNDGDSSRPAAAETTQPAPSQPAVQSQRAQSQAEQPAASAQPQPPAENEVQSSTSAADATPTRGSAVATRGKGSRKKTAIAPVSAVIVPGQMAVDSTPQGAQVQIDGKTDPTWVTPFSLSGLTPGQHSITVSKAGYITDSRAVDVVSGSKSFVVTHLAQLMASLAVSSTPAGANVYVDGKDTGKLTPAQVSLDKGQHVVLVRKSGFIDETTNAQFVLGQTVRFSPTLRSLCNVDDIRTVGKMKRLFGGKETQGMGTVSIKTQPKGAQVAVNQHMLDKESPVDFVLDPGNYIVDITMTGYAPIHKVITVDKGGKAVIDEVMQRE